MVCQNNTAEHLFSVVPQLHTDGIGAVRILRRDGRRVFHGGIGAVVFVFTAEGNHLVFRYGKAAIRIVDFSGIDGFAILVRGEKNFILIRIA